LLGRPTILVTGASGYIGAHLVARAHDAGFRVIAAARRPKRLRLPPGVEARSFDLGLPLDPGLLKGVDVVVHLGAVIYEDSQPPGAVEDVNVGGTRRLLESARESGVRRFLFVTTQSATPSAPTKYGRSKWQIERLLTGPGEIIVKPGMVTGGPRGGVYGALLASCRRFPVLPLIHGSAPVYPVHVDDVCDAILAIAASAEANEMHGRVVRIAPKTPVSFANYLRMLAGARLGRTVVIVPLPAALLIWANRLAATTRLLPSVPEERLLGLAALKPVNEDPSCFVEGPLRDVRAALAAEAGNRRLLLEGRTLLKYVLGTRLPAAASRRYVKAVLGEHDATPLALPLVVVLWPRALRLLEPVGGPPTGKLRRRLSIAMRIAEMTPQAAPVFHHYGPGARVVAAVRLAGIAVAEACLLPIRLLASRAWSRSDRSAGT
jgi:NADH dehydrogenase